MRPDNTASSIDVFTDHNHTAHNLASASPEPSSILHEEDQAAYAQVVQLPLSYNEECTRPTDLESRTLEEVKSTFHRRGMRLEEVHIEAVKKMVSTMRGMADASCDPAIYLSSLDPGMGKTTVMVAFLRQLVSDPERGDAGVLICLSRLDEIQRLVKEAGLDEEDFATLCSDETVSKLSATPHNQAQVLFTTQQMVLKRGNRGTFSSLDEFHFQGQPRHVRIWEETLDPVEVVTVSEDELCSLRLAVKKRYASLADAIRPALASLMSATNGDTLMMSTFDGIEAIRTVDAEHQRTLQALSKMSGHRVRTIRKAGQPIIALNTRDALPDGIAPLLVLDASGRVRKTYDSSIGNQPPVVHLPPCPKDYSPMTINLMDQGGGKDSWRQNGDQLAQEVAHIIATKPDEEWLVIHHKANGSLDPAGLIKGYLPDGSDNVHFLHWGQHQATNRFKDVPNVILSGLMHLPETLIHGLALAHSGNSLSDAPTSEAMREMELGELGHAVLQAVGRGRTRGMADGKCPAGSVYIIAATRYRLGQKLSDWFPGSKLKPWRRQFKSLSGKVRQAVKYIEARCRANPGEPIMFYKLMEHVGISDRSNFNKTIRRHPDFKAAVERLGLEEVRELAARGFDALKRPFGPIEGAAF